MESQAKRTITLSQAKRLILQRQSLWPPRSLKGKAGILEHFANVRLLQYDPVNLVGNNPQINLNARVKDFKPDMLNDLLYRDQALVDMWDRCASIVLDEDLEAMYLNRGDTNWRQRADVDITDEHVQEVKRLFQEAEQPLPLSAIKDKVLRETLLRMLPQGEIGIASRQGPIRFFRLNDLVKQQRYQESDFFANPDDFYDWMLTRRIASVGLVIARDAKSLTFQSIRGLTPAIRRAAIQRLLTKGVVEKVDIAGGPSVYLLTEDLPLLEAPVVKPAVSFLGPLDNCIWDRELLEKVFNFFYRWEIYNKEETRQYGPYTLPVLYGENIVARIQMLSKEGYLEVEGFWWEKGQKLTKTLTQALQVAFKSHARMLDLEPEKTPIWMRTY